MSERMFLLRSSSRTAMCVLPRFILNKNKFPLMRAFQTGCPNILTSVCVLNSQFHGEMSS